MMTRPLQVLFSVLRDEADARHGEPFHMDNESLATLVSSRLGNRVGRREIPGMMMTLTATGLLEVASQAGGDYEGIRVLNP